MELDYFLEAQYEERNGFPYDYDDSFYDDDFDDEGLEDEV